VAADIFEGSVGFHRNERCSLAYDKRILEKSPLGQFCKSAFSRGVACHSRAMKKKLARSGSGRQSSQGFTFTVNSASVVHGDAAATVPERLGHKT
jgi:hypothetical protein